MTKDETAGPAPEGGAIPARAAAAVLEDERPEDPTGSMAAPPPLTLRPAAVAPEGAAAAPPPPPPPRSIAVADPDAPLRRALARHRAIATGLLLMMVGIMLGAYQLPPGYWADLLQAAAKAGVVGGIADWFAVTALFRRPLGLPIPHTAIIPRQKERLGQGLGRFVANHVFTEAEVARVLGRLDLAGILRGFMADPATARPAAEAIATAMPRLLASLEDGRARRLMGRLLPRLAGGPGGARIVARALRTLVEGGKHQEVFDLAIRELRRLLVEKEDQLRNAIEVRVREEGGRLVGWALGAAVAGRVLAAVNAELARMEADDSDLRHAFEEWIKGEVERLETDPERAAALGRAMRSAMSHPTVTAWLGDVWDRLRAALVADAANPQGRTVTLLEGAFRNAGNLLAEDPAARERLNHGVQRFLATLLPSARQQLAGFIAQVVAGWDTAQVTDKIELRVGRDLQYVRMNGTLVGFLVGGALFAALTALFGRVAF
ncbi:DUF445 domain-containing protein [Paracraurococcus lichenis]|uniref:DUF445 domain-containing protein n=1 Tax=Paracraurococcus lichenis TaxID=3064888 RepID=A0ABT9DS94_9PROT|nr:DUF445 domain-containing protein [Paracraurococcus sp. LOR1-02]MDO9706772.1 DUF445 domain-containing protein [Paracraurococcus sp. LOR1-02]